MSKRMRLPAQVNHNQQKAAAVLKRRWRRAKIKIEFGNGPPTFRSPKGLLVIRAVCNWEVFLVPEALQGSALAAGVQ